MSKQNKAPETEAVDTQIAELTADLQRMRADFENYRKNVERDKAFLVAATERKVLIRFLPVLDDIERAAGHVPAELADNPWAEGVANLTKKLAAALKEVGVTKINAQSGSKFDPNLHEAVTSGNNGEKITEELRSGYLLDGEVIRPSMVNVD
ncbi:nucleotide exchange factor GrpE [Candidatus Saccharibacteria bacterium]|nr:nucleotide exchange factor GrpE [Candidatus Saccharibacteria bacterium]